MGSGAGPPGHGEAAAVSGGGCARARGGGQRGPPPLEGAAAGGEVGEAMEETTMDFSRCLASVWGGGKDRADERGRGVWTAAWRPSCCCR